MLHTPSGSFSSPGICVILLQKTGYRNRLELAVKARHFGLIIADEPGTVTYDNSQP